MINNKKEVLLKKLIFKSSNMGWRENDLMLGEFARNNLRYYDEPELLVYAEFLKEVDPEIFAYLTKQKPLTQKYNTKLINKLIEYNNDIR